MREEAGHEGGRTDVKARLSLLWIFVTVNYIFCDVFTLMYSEELKRVLSGTIGQIEVTQGFLLAFAVLMEIPMVMIVLSRVLKYRTSRLTSIIAGILLTLVQAWSLFTGTPTLHYVFFSIVEIATTLFIVWTALRWREGGGDVTATVCA
jgi:hypothetical protein